MKKLLILLFSLLLLSSTSIFAGDISDFEIEGISIGDSLLDYMTENEILEEIEISKNDYYYLNEPNKYADVYKRKDLSTYDLVSFSIKNNSTNEFLTNKNEKYTILYIRGMITYNEDFDGCIVKRNEIAEVLSKMFPNAQKIEEFYEFPSDPSGNSTVDAVTFKFSSGAEEIDAYCENLEENFRIKKRWSESLNVSISSAETTSWMRDYK